MLLPEDSMQSLRHVLKIYFCINEIIIKQTFISLNKMLKQF